MHSQPLPTIRVCPVYSIRLLSVACVCWTLVEIPAKKLSERRVLGGARLAQESKAAFTVLP